jgi:hypothetical protein
MSSIYDQYLKDNIMDNCLDYFRQYLTEEEAMDEILTEEDQELIYKQIDYIMDMIVRIYNENEDERDALAEIVDKLIGFCIVGKMNEARFCRLLNEKEK